MPQLTVLGVIKLVVFIAATAYSIKQQRKIKKAMRNLGNIQGEAQGRLQSKKDSAAYKQVVYGETRVGGTIIFNHNSGSGNGVKHILIEIADHHVDSIYDVKFDEELIQIDGGGNVLGRFIGYANVWFYKNASEREALTRLQIECGDLWDSTHKCTDTAGIYVRIVYKEDMWPNGVPNVSAMCRGKKIHDPRTDMTVWSNNAALCLADFYCDKKHGLGFDYDSEIDEAELIASANVCDEIMTLADDSTEKRYMCNGSFTCDTIHSDVIEQMKAAMAGFVIDPPGRVGIVAGYWRPATLPAFDENTLTSGLSVTTKTPMADNCNRVKGMYISRDHDWQATDYPPVVNATYLAQDNAVEMWREISYTFVTSSSQSQRLGKIALEESRQGITVRGSGNFAWFQVRAGDVIKFSNVRRGWVEKEFLVERIGIDTTSGTIVFPFTLRETAEGVYDWNNGEETTVDLAPNTNLPSPFNVAPPSALTVLSDNTTREYDAVTDQYIQRMLVSWTAPADAFVTNGGTIRIQFRKTSDTLWKDWSPVGGSQTQDYIFPIITGVAYIVRMRSENRLGTPSPWIYSLPTTNSGDTTAPAAPTAFTADGGVGGVSLAWTNPADSDLAFIDVYESTTNTPAPTGGSTPLVSIGDEDLSGVVDDAYFRAGLPGGAVRHYWIRAVDTSGNRSAWVGPRGATTVTAFSVVADPSSIYKTHVGSAAVETSQSIVITTGGIAPFSFQWEEFKDGAWVNATNGESFILQISNPVTPNPFWAMDAVLAIGTYSGLFRCVATDAAAQTAVTNEVSVAINVTSM